jgi:tRNA (guanine37-N1)-methyltransferase
MSPDSADASSIFSPPINRSMQTLDREFFRKSVALTAGRISDLKRVATIRDILTQSREVLQVYSIKSVVPDDEDPKTKYILLNPDVKLEGRTNFKHRLMLITPFPQMKALGLLSFENWLMMET